MIDREAAVQIVQGQLARDYEADRAVRSDPILLAVAGVDEHELVWIVSWTSDEYLRTGNRDFRLVGNGPYLVDRLDGSLHQIGVVSAVTDGWQEDYRTRNSFPGERCAPRRHANGSGPWGDGSRSVRRGSRLGC
ncbi:YrhB domain-containing protein [Streptomyces microflavus]|uniref:YrhB domain-containing protein n=1 Tax=Streptomyces microflavus TaxID=1919 RepID=UPI000998CA63|nr:YrhB domain-containing protein [Streptomyces microflavus]